MADDQRAGGSSAGLRPGRVGKGRIAPDRRSALRAAGRVGCLREARRDGRETPVFSLSP